jgi:hypothetical protein
MSSYTFLDPYLFRHDDVVRKGSSATCSVFTCSVPPYDCLPNPYTLVASPSRSRGDPGPGRLTGRNSSGSAGFWRVARATSFRLGPSSKPGWISYDATLE